MYTLFNNIVSDTIHSIVVCVDFLGTHTANLVLSLKLGVTITQTRVAVNGAVTITILAVN